MPSGRQEPPKTALALLDSVLASRTRTHHAILLLTASGVVATSVLTALLVIMSVFGVTGTAVAGVAGLAASTGAVVRRRRQVRRRRDALAVRRGT